MPTIEEVENYKYLMIRYNEQKDYTNAGIYADKYLKTAMNPSAEDYNYAGCVYNSKYMNVSQNTIDATKSYYYFDKASDLKPDKHLYAKNATIMASKINNYCGGRKHWYRLFNMDSPLTNDDFYDYAAFCLKTGNIKKWGEYFDYRFQKETTPTQFPRITGPRWRGEDLTNKTLLVYFEQGFGDTILMFGYMKRLKSLANEVIYVVQKSLYPLLKDNKIGVTVFPSDDEKVRYLKFDYYIPSMSIPIVLGLNKNDISVGESFIEVDENSIKEFRDKYINDNHKINIGLSVRGSITGDLSRDIDSESIKLLNINTFSIFLKSLNGISQLAPLQ